MTERRVSTHERWASTSFLPVMSVGLRGLAALDHCKLNGPWVGPALRNGQGLGYVPVATWEGKGREGKVRE